MLARQSVAINLQLAKTSSSVKRGKARNDCILSLWSRVWWCEHQSWPGSIQVNRQLGGQPLSALGTGEENLIPALNKNQARSQDHLAE